MYQILVVVAAVAAFYFYKKYSIPNTIILPDNQHARPIEEKQARELSEMKRSNSPSHSDNALPPQVNVEERQPDKKQKVEEPVAATTNDDTKEKEAAVETRNANQAVEQQADDDEEPKSFFDSPPPVHKPIKSDKTPQVAVAEQAPANTTADVPAAKAENSQESELESKFSVRYGLYEIQGKRKEMEDAHHAEVTKNGRAFFGVYDGHGGRRAADFLAEHLHKFLMAHPELHSNTQEAMRCAFTKTENDFMDLAYKDQLEDGSTAVVALVLGAKLFVGNIGDSEAILCHNGKAVCLSTLHNPSKNPSEITRVQEAGGRLYYNRVGHPVINPVLFNIAVSRAIGDIMYKHEEWTSGKKSGLIAEPDIKLYQITPEDSFLILACDGLWDVFSYQSAVDFVKERLKETNDPQKIAEAIVQESERRDTTDNVTVCIVLFDHL